MVLPGSQEIIVVHHKCAMSQALDLSNKLVTPSWARTRPHDTNTHASSSIFCVLHCDTTVHRVCLYIRVVLRVSFFTLQHTCVCVYVCTHTHTLKACPHWIIRAGSNRFYRVRTGRRSGIEPVPLKPPRVVVSNRFGE